MEQKTQWERGNYCAGECDVVGCHNKPFWRNWEKDSLGMSGSDDLLASLCNDHKQYKSFNTTERIIEATQFVSSDKE